MRRERNVKIVATLGPASSTKEMIARLFAAGADVFRINMSHTPHDKLKALVETIREVEAENAPADRHPGRPPGAEDTARRGRGRRRR